MCTLRYLFLVSEVTLYCERNVVGGYMSVPCVLGLALRPCCAVCVGVGVCTSSKSNIQKNVELTIAVKPYDDVVCFER